MKGLNISTEQELQMTYSPILGTSYQLVNVVTKIESTIQQECNNKQCKHIGKSLMEIADRKLCMICGTWTNDTK